MTAGPRLYGRVLQTGRRDRQRTPSRAGIKPVGPLPRGASLPRPVMFWVLSSPQIYPLQAMSLSAALPRRGGKGRTSGLSVVLPSTSSSFHPARYGHNEAADMIFRRRILYELSRV